MYTYDFSILNKILESYKTWLVCLNDSPKIYRYSLGLRIDNLFIDIVRGVIDIKYKTSNEKSASLANISSNLDLLKVLLNLFWELRLVDTNRYTNLSLTVDEFGRMLGGWIRKGDLYLRTARKL